MTPKPVRAKRLWAVRDNRSGGAGLPLLAVSIHHGVVPRSQLTEDEPRADDLSAYKVVAAGDIVVNRMRAFQGAVGVAPTAGIVSPDYLVLQPQGASPRYLHYLMRSRWMVGEMSKRLRGIGSVDQGNVRTPRINIDELGDIVVDCPDESRQRAIVAFLDAETSRIDILIERMQRQTGLLLERRAALIERSVTGGQGSHRSESSIEWARSLPAHWREARLTLVSQLGSGHTPSRDRPEWWMDCTVPWITTGEVAQMRSDRIEEITETREMISEAGLANSSATVHPKGTVVLCRTASAGYSAIMGKDMATSQDFATWTCGPLLRPRYLLLCLRAMRRDLLERLAMGSTHKTIYMPDIEAIRVPLPPVEEQDEIVERAWRQLHAIDRAVDAIEQHIGLLQERKQALITAAVTGELDVAREIAEEAS